MIWSERALFAASLAFIAKVATGRLVINEIMRNPAGDKTERSGEWFEFFNPMEREVDINGWSIKDDGTNSHVINNGGQLVIAPGGFLVLGNNADVATNGGVNLDYEYDRNRIHLNNDFADELILLNGTTEVDRVNWDGGFAGSSFPNIDGAAMALLDPTLNNSVGSSWCNAITPYGTGNKGTPGAPNICPVPTLVINEIMRNPANVTSQRVGEWFELYNPTDRPMDINGWTIKDDGTNLHVINNGAPLVVTSGGYLVLGNNANTTSNGGVPVDYEYDSDRIKLNNEADDELILMAASVEVDRVNWDGGSSASLFPNEAGVAMALLDPSLDNNVSSNWCNAITPYGVGEKGTPGRANVCQGPPLVINEIMRNPANVASERVGEWFELFNPTDRPVDIDGWAIKDDGTNSHVIANGGPLVLVPGGYLVLGNNADVATNGGVVLDYEYETDRIFMNNADDELVLLAGTVEIDRVNWDGVSPGNFPNEDGVAMSLIDPSLDNNVSSNWCSASKVYGNGDKGTPGAANICPPPTLVINEIMRNPKNVVTEREGEWFELFNPTGSAFDINGWTIKDDRSNRHVIDNGGPLVIPQWGYVVLGNNANVSTNGGVVVDYEYDSTRIHLNNDPDELILLAGSVEVDRVSWNGAFPNVDGVAMALIDPTSDNNVSGNWCQATTIYGNGDRGTPKAVNDCHSID